jgi:hypothetical protein
MAPSDKNETREETAGSLLPQMRRILELLGAETEQPAEPAAEQLNEKLADSIAWNITRSARSAAKGINAKAWFYSQSFVGGR